MALNVSIEKATPDDFEEIVEVWEASVRATHDFLPEEDILFFKELVAGGVLEQVALYCAKDENLKISGFLGTHDKSLEMLFLKPDSFGTGLGRKLLEFAILNEDVNILDVNEQNPKALAFYEHMGFEVISRTEVDPLGKPYPILKMALKSS